MCYSWPSGWRAIIAPIRLIESRASSALVVRVARANSHLGWSSACHNSGGGKVQILAAPHPGQRSRQTSWRCHRPVDGGTSGAKPTRIDRTEMRDTTTDHLMGDDDPTLSEQVLDVPEAECEAQIQSNGGRMTKQGAAEGDQARFEAKAGARVRRRCAARQCRVPTSVATVFSGSRA